ncbi:MAG: AbgT family transporter, partial [Phycisphaerales bacterium]
MTENPEPTHLPPPPKPRGAFARFLAIVEWLGNLLPHPVTLFALFALGVVIVSHIAKLAGLQVEDPRPTAADGAILVVTSLLESSSIRWMSESLVTNFTGFVPLGTVLVALLGVGVAEKSGLLTSAIRAMVLGAPRSMVTLVVVFAAVVSNTASEMGYVVIIPLAMALFHSLGRHPLAGMAAAFAGVSGGYSANLLIGTVDPLLAGITQEAAQLYDPEYTVHPAVNWYFMIASTFLITGLGWFVTEKIVEPRLGKYDPSMADEDIDRAPILEKVNRAEINALKWAGVSVAIVTMGFVVLAGPRWMAPFLDWLPGFGVLRDPNEHNPDPEKVVEGIAIMRPMLN